MRTTTGRKNTMTKLEEYLQLAAISDALLDVMDVLWHSLTDDERKQLNDRIAP